MKKLPSIPASNGSSIGAKPTNPVEVEVPELPGYMANGATYEEAVANAQTVVREWIDTARPLGRPILEPKGQTRLCLRAWVFMNEGIAFLKQKAIPRSMHSSHSCSIKIPTLHALVCMSAINCMTEDEAIKARMDEKSSKFVQAGELNKDA